MAKPNIQKKSHRRNEPCPCGSGKKFKHCCLKKQWRDAEERTNAFFEEGGRLNQWFS